MFCASCDAVVFGDQVIAYSSGFVLCARCATHNTKKKRKRREKPQQEESVDNQITSYWLEEAFRAAEAAPPTGGALSRLLEKCSDHTGILGDEETSKTNRGKKRRRRKKA